MSRADLTARYSNPFSSRFVRPGAMPFVCPTGVSLTGLVERFGALGERAQIVGPHGAGKSTLLAALREEFGGRGCRVVVWELHAGEGPRCWPRLPERPGAGEVWLVDGLEQIGAVARSVLLGRLAWSGAGLVGTTHRDLGLPTLLELSPSPALAAELVTQLCGGDPCGPTAEEVREAYDRANGNLREVLFDLYGRYEARRRHEPQPKSNGAAAAAAPTPLGHSTSPGT